MRKVIQLLKRFFTTEVTQTIESSGSRNSKINQTAYVSINHFLLPSIVLALFFALLIFVGYTEYQRSNYDLSMMPAGQLNVAIVPFSDLTYGECDATNDTGSLVASAFYSGLVAGEYDDIPNKRPVFRSPLALPPFKVSEYEDLATAAQELAVQINAQIVIYGTITCTEVTHKPSANVSFFVAPSGFGDADELIGEFSFRSGALYGDLGSGQDFLSSNENLQQKIAAMSLLVHSLGLYLGENYDTALETLSVALALPLWDKEGGKEVVLIIAGNAEMRFAQQLIRAGHEARALQEIEYAREYYQSANKSSKASGLGEYGRSYIGLAGVEHFYATYKSHLSCDYKYIDFEKFELEKQFLNAAKHSANSPVTADIPEKIAFNTAQINLTLYAVDPTSVQLDVIEQNYNFVISSYTNIDRPNLRIRELAAHSYAGLGFMGWYKGDADSIQRNFDLAITTTESPSLQVGYLRALGNYYLLNNEYKKALVYYQEALGITKEFRIEQAKCDSDLVEVISDLESRLK